MDADVAGEKENAATIVSSSEVLVAMKMNVETSGEVVEKQNLEVNVLNTEDHKIGNGGNSIALEENSDYVTNNITLGKRKHDEASAETDSKKVKVDSLPDTTNNVTSVSVPEQKKPTSDSQISSSDDVDMKTETTDNKSAEVSPKGNCESSTSIPAVVASTANGVKHDSSSSVAVKSSIGADILKIDTSNAVASTAKSEISLDTSSPPKEDPSSLDTTESKSSNESNPHDDSDDLLERLDAIDSAYLRKPDLKLEEIDKTDLEEDDLLNELEKASNGTNELPTESSKSIEKKATVIPSTEIRKPDIIEKESELSLDLKLQEQTPKPSIDKETEIVDSSSSGDVEMKTAEVIVKPVLKTVTNEAEAIVTESLKSALPANESDVKKTAVDSNAQKTLSGAPKKLELKKIEAKKDNVATDSTTTTIITHDKGVAVNKPKLDDKKKYSTLETTAKPPVVVTKKVEVPKLETKSPEKPKILVMVNKPFSHQEKSTKAEEPKKIESPASAIDKAKVTAVKIETKKPETQKSPPPKPSIINNPSSMANSAVPKKKDKIDVVVAKVTENKPKEPAKIVAKEQPLPPIKKNPPVKELVIKSKAPTETITILDSDSDDGFKKAVTPTEKTTKTESKTEKPVEKMETDQDTPKPSSIVKEKVPEDIKAIDKVVVSAETKKTLQETEEKMEVDAKDETVEATELIESVIETSIIKPEDIVYRIKTSVESNNVLHSISIEMDENTDQSPSKDIVDKSWNVTGTLEICNFAIDYFTKIKKSLKSNASYNEGSSYETPHNKAKSFSRAKGATTKKLSKAINTSTPKANSSSEFVVPAADNLYDAKKYNVNVLARWIDKKYYAGKILQAKPGNKYVVQFEDGATKTLTTDCIIFGNDISLPLLDQFVHARTENEEYEAGLVTSIDIEDGNVIYTVIAESKTVQVKCTDIYLELDQAKVILDMQKENPPTIDNVALSNDASLNRSRGKRNSKSALQTPTPGYSGGVAEKKGRGRGKRPQPHSESSDISDIIDSEPNSPEQQSALEQVDGVQPELQTTATESELNKITLLQDYIKSTGETDKKQDDILGPIPLNKSLFRNKHFILTCTIPMKTTAAENEKDDLKNKHKQFTKLPFIKEHLRSQITEGGGKVYEHFEDIPKNKYKQCKVIAPHPCVTARYIQCLAAEIPAISHEWIIESCQNGVLSETKAFALPSGWSIIENSYIKWAVGRNSDQRSSVNPLSNQVILMASFNKDFIDFWTRVCKLAGATIRIIKSITDVNQGLTGVMLTDEDFPQDIKLKAEHFTIPIVSNVWVVQCLVLGKPCKPDSHDKFKRYYQDDDF